METRVDVESLKNIERNSEQLINNLKELEIPKKERYIVELNRYLNKVKTYREKFEKNILEVAFAGVEKMGKSTFANAFIGNKLLPSKAERATYVTTQVKYAPKDKVVVKFYTYDEYISQVLHPLLKEMGIKNYENYNLDNLEEVKSILKELEKESLTEYQRLKSGNYINEFEEILEGIEKIKELLNGGEKVYEGEDLELKRKEYIEFITDKAKSRAVKEVTIYSSNLKNLENVIIYDLPGFDSPTVIHSKFTEEKLKSADAIVYVRQAHERPNLTAPEVQIITKTEEEDGLKLKEKLFFFLNKADKATSIKEIEEVLETFIRELKKYDLFKGEDRIIIGSAYARLVKLGLEDDQSVLKRLEDLGIKTDGIDEIKQKLWEYTKKDRRRILEDRLKHVLKNFSELLTELREDLQKKESYTEGKELIKLSQELQSIITNDVAPVLDEYYGELKDKLEKERELSNKILEKYRIEISMLDEKTRRNIELKVIGGSYGGKDSFKADEYDAELRKELFNHTREIIHQLPEQVVIEKQNQVKREILDKIIQKIKPEKKNEFREELEKFIDKHLKNYVDEIYGIRVIFLRFIGDFMEWLIRRPRGSQDRYKTFKDIYEDFSYYISMYVGSDNNREKYMQASKSDELNRKFEEILNELRRSRFFGLKNEFDENKSKELMAKFMNLSDVSKKHILSRIEEVRSEKGNITLRSIEKILDEVIEGNGDFLKKEKGIKSSIEYLREFMEKFKNREDTKYGYPDITRYRTSPRDVDKEIEDDLEAFKELIEKVLIHAINPEKAFIIVVGDFINKLKEVLQSKEGQEFIRDTLNLVYYTKIKELNRIKKQNELARNSLELIGHIQSSILSIL